MSAASDADHAPRRCRAKECPTEVPHEMFMCAPHWSMVPAALRDALKATTPSGQDLDNNPSPEYLAFAKAAIAEVAHKETRHRRRIPPTPGKPAQLTLF